MKVLPVIAAVMAVAASPLIACPISKPFDHLTTSKATVVPKRQTTGIARHWRPTAHLATAIDRRYGPAEWVDMYWTAEGNVK
jgi:hypothetical protein